MIKAIFFDFYGVVKADDYAEWLKAHNLKKEGIFLDISRQQDKGQISHLEFLRKLSKLTGLEINDENYLQKNSINSELINLIKTLKPKYKIYVQSNSPRGTVRSIILDHKLSDYFDGIIISSEIGMIKPQRGFYQYILNYCHASKPEVLFVDDNPFYIAGAQKFGIKSIHFKSNKQLVEDLKKINVL